MTGAPFSATDELGVGPALDAEIDRRLFGKSWVRSDYVVVNGVRQDVETWLPDADWCSADNPPGGWTWGMKPPPYSTSISAAMTVFEALVEMTGAGSIHADMEDARGEGFVVTVWIGREHPWTCTGPLPLAICRVALRVVPDDERADAAGRDGDA